MGDGLSTPDTLRYARHLVLDGVGEDGQERLLRSSVLVVGAGGLGSPALLYLAAAGVGRIGLVEFDLVDLSNLQRQIVHGTRDVGVPKIDSAARRLAEVNPGVELVRHAERFTSDNARDLVRGYDLVLDGSDNFPTRYLVNDACVLEGVPFVYGAVLQWEGQVSVFGAPAGPCYRCLFREPPPAAMVQNCAEAGVFGALPGIIGSTQALEALKWLLGADGKAGFRSLAGRLLLLDGRAMQWREMELRRAPDCPVCGDDPTVTELIDYEVFCGVRADGTPLDAPGEPVIEGLGAAELRDLLAAERPPLIVDVREEWEWRVGNLADLGATHLPLGELEARAAELPDRDLVLVCSVGARSRAAALHLRTLGRPRVRHLEGGLQRWRTEVDPALDVV